MPRFRVSLLLLVVFSVSLVSSAPGCSSPPVGKARPPEAPAPPSETSAPLSTPFPAPETVVSVEENLAAPPSSLRLGDVIYERLEPAEVTERGPLAGEVEQLVPDNIDKTGYEWLESGDSNHLKPGTLVYAAKGYDPAFRVVARGDGGWTLYEVAANRSAGRVAELLDVGGRTVLVSIRGNDQSASAEVDPFQGVRETTAFVDAVLGTPLVRVSADYSYVRSLVFTLEDGTQTACFYEPDSGELYLSEEDPFLGVVLPEKLREDLRRAP